MPAPAQVVHVRMLGPFSVSVGARAAGPWARPAARRLCELVMLSPGRRTTKQYVREALFPNLRGPSATNQLNQALSRARSALAAVGPVGAALLCADRLSIWADPAIALDVDLEVLEANLRAALTADPGPRRDALLVAALAEPGLLLSDEPFADWASRRRERLEWDRLEARLALARDRSRGMGRSSPDAVVESWQACLDHDPTCEEAATALVRTYAAQKRPSLADAIYVRCRQSLEALGLNASPALEEAHAVVASAASASPAPVGPARFREERRLVSVLFAELTGAPGTSAHLGPEELRELVSGVLAEVVRQVESFGGTVTSVSGSGLVALFGAPEAHEDDPERALRAAFGAVEQPHRDHFSLRVAVETGEAVVGPLVGARTSYYGAVGEVVGLAAALQSVARPGSVLVGPATRAATEGIFVWGPAEEVAASPSAKPVHASYLERPKARPVGEPGRRGLARNVPLVGRRLEVATLRDLLRALVGGQGSVALIAGEPGLGKTRLVGECRRLFLTWTASGSGRLPLWLEGRAASYASSSPYGLYRQLLASWVGVRIEDGEEEVRRALERAVTAIFSGRASDEELEILGRLMGLPPERDLRLTPEQLQQATFSAFCSLVSRLIARGPTVVVLEDLHWADPTSLHLTAQLAPLVRDGPLLVAMTRRPEPDPGVSALEGSLAEALGPEFHLLELAPLTTGESRDLARSLLSEGATPDAVDIISEGTDGNPLFIEERLTTLLETGALSRDASGWRIDRSLSGAVPEALERLVRARIDRLPAEPRDAVVAASVLGPEFTLSALRAVTDLDGSLDQAISELCSGGLLIELGGAPEPAYRFRHALIQEATYRGLVRAERRRLHSRAAWGMEQAYTGSSDEIASVLGRHFAFAGEAERAAHYLEVAGDRAAAAFANDEAVASYRYGLDVLGQEDLDKAGPAAAVMAKAAIGLRAKLGQVLFRTGRYAEARDTLSEGLGALGRSDRFGAARLQALVGRVEMADHRYDDAMAAFDAADELLGEHPEDGDQATVELWLEVQLDGRALLHYWRNEPAMGAAVLAKARPVVDARGSPYRRQLFYASLANQQARQARYRIDEEILANITTAVAAAREAGGEHDLAYRTFTLGLCLCFHGDLAEAGQQLEAALAIGERTGDVVHRARCLCYLNLTALRRHDVGAVRSLAPLAMASAEAVSYPEYVAGAKATQAWVAWREERHEDVVTLAGEALELWGNTVVAVPWYWVCLWPLVAVRLATGKVGEAVEAARMMLAPPQQRLPDELESALQAAVSLWENGEERLAGVELGEAVALAERLRFA